MYLFTYHFQFTTDYVVGNSMRHIYFFMRSNRRECISAKWPSQKRKSILLVFEGNSFSSVAWTGWLIHRRVPQNRNRHTRYLSASSSTSASSLYAWLRVPTHWSSSKTSSDESNIGIIHLRSFTQTRTHQKKLLHLHSIVELRSLKFRKLSNEFHGD